MCSRSLCKFAQPTLRYALCSSVIASVLSVPVYPTLYVLCPCVCLESSVAKLVSAFTHKAYSYYHVTFLESVKHNTSISNVNVQYQSQLLLLTTTTAVCVMITACLSGHVLVKLGASWCVSSSSTRLSHTWRREAVSHFLWLLQCLTPFNPAF